MMFVAKKNDSVVKEVVERDGSADELRAYLHLRATGRNDLGYHEPTRDQEPDVAPEYGVAPGVDLYNPPPSEEMQKSGRARSAYALGRINANPGMPQAALSLEEKEEMADEILEAEVRPNVELTGADEDGNLPESDGLPSDVQKVAVVDEDGDVK